jgi:hypothetical protein
MEKKKVASTLSRLGGTFWVTRTVEEKGHGGRGVLDEHTKNENATIEIVPFEGEVARVGLDASMTINIGNFQSAKVGVFLSVPCYLEEVDEMYDVVKRTVEKRMGEEVAEVQEMKRKGAFN